MKIPQTRRCFLASAGTAVITDSLFAQQSAITSDDALDEALSQFHRDEPQAVRGLSTHAPMAIEAICSMGFPDQALPWLNNQRAPKRTLPRPANPINPAHWKEALGPDTSAVSWEKANHRWGDWKEFFVKLLAEQPWKDVLNTWVSRLAPGLSGAATHGIIRTAHAVRSMGRRHNAVRQTELAHGLAYWASSYEELPAKVRDKPGYASFAEALNEVPLYRQAFGETLQGRNIVEVLRLVPKLDSFAQVRDLITIPADLNAAFSALSATFTRVYLRYGSQANAIAFIHAITGPAALRRMAPFLKPEVVRQGFPYAWQTAAAIFSAYVPNREKLRNESSKLTPQELAARSVKNGDEHAIKLTELMLSEYQLQPDPVYLAAAEQVTGNH